MHKFWKDLAVTSLHRAPAHSPWGAYENAAQAAGRAPSRYISSLNGIFHFKLFDAPELVDDFYLPDYDDSAFQKIDVPGNWETQGFCSPIYTNIPYPWKNDESTYNPPLPPAQNPTGCYRKWFDLEGVDDSGDFFIRFEGVETAFLIWVNGEFVGYSEDSKLPCEFEITLRPSKNLLAVQVMRFASSSWIEDQDYWHLSGVFRNVSLIKKPKLRIQDWTVIATPNLLEGMGKVEANVVVSRVEGFTACKVRATLFAPDGTPLADKESLVSEKSAFSVRDGLMTGEAKVEFSVIKPKLWDPDSPNLYMVVFTLIDGEGCEVDFESCRTGFRLVEIKSGILLFNGRRLIVRGVNRHEHCPSGRYISTEYATEEIRRMKRLHINAVRTSHYPASPEWYDLCDEYGLLVLCECNIESHGLGAMLSTDPAWSGVYLERAVRMAQQYKNHPSIYGWSLGNESGFGANHAAMYGWLREYDKTRLCQYESAEPGANISDVRGLMYAPQERILSMLADSEDTRPIVLVEYLYQICNSGGGAYNFRNLTEKFPRFQGGFVWDWTDKALIAKDESGESFFGYGGDFDEPISEEVQFMCCNGVLLPDLTPKPVAYEIKAIYAPFRIDRRDGVGTWNTTPDYTRYALTNSSFSESSDDFEYFAVWKEDGVEIKRNELSLPFTAPGETSEFNVSASYETKQGCEYHIDFIVRRKKPSRFEDDGDVVSITQYKMPGGKHKTPRPSHDAASKKVFMSELRGNQLIISFDDLEAVFDIKTGNLEGLYYLKRKVLSVGQPVFARPITGLDCRPGWGWYEETDLLSNADINLTSTEKSERGVTFEYAVDTVCPLTARTRYQLSSRGIEVEYMVTARGGWRVLPRVGLLFSLPEGMEKLTYFGYGSNECYSDRMESVQLGVYESTVKEQSFPFIPPSETGGHEGTRWLTLNDKNNAGIYVKGDAPFHFDARHNTVEDYRSARHTHKLPNRRETFLHLDVAHSPIGGHMAWSTDVDERVMLGDGLYANRFIIEIMEENDEIAK